MTAINSFEDNQVWNDCLKYIALRIKKHSYNTWFRHTKAGNNVEGNNGKPDSLIIKVPNQFVADWLKGHYSDLISEAINEVGTNGIAYSFETYNCEDIPQTEMELSASQLESEPLTTRPQIPPANSLNKRYNFDNLVVGDFNQFAHAAAVAVAGDPGATNYNPLFIYGGTGLGKTHLAQAIGQQVLKNNQNKKIIYASSEKFTSDFINSISTGTISSFSSKYRNADVLLIDDIQFFSGKESTQEQFFHTFNDLYHAGKQIVLTSDRHPHETKGLEERLLSRFSSGLIADLQQPTMETRVAILRAKAEREKIPVPEDALYFIADNITSNIRDLEGCLNKLLAYSSLEKVKIDLDFTKRILGKEINRTRKEITVSLIQQKTSEFFRIDQNLMKARKKTAQVAQARQIAMYLSRKYTSLSLKDIGDAFGGRDHSTVIHACDLITKKIYENFELKEKVEAITAKLLN
ncbi:MAG: chromosomal replication initiator protein DnaA [candidate division Zixibacteria bacterium]|nr:chromosomal replication initiator protein DnaA [candidate division Zixibacteria bacterium]